MLIARLRRVQRPCHDSRQRFRNLRGFLNRLDFLMVHAERRLAFVRPRQRVRHVDAPTTELDDGREPDEVWEADDEWQRLRDEYEEAEEVNRR